MNEKEKKKKKERKTTNLISMFHAIKLFSLLY